MRISDWSSDVCSSDLDHGRHHAADRIEVDAHGEILERGAPVGEEAQFDRGQREFVAELGITLAELAGNAVEGRVDGEAGLGADDEQVERVGKSGRASCRERVLQYG